MKVIYIKSFHTNEDNIEYENNINCIVLKEDNWNDYGYYTYFHTYLWYENKLYTIGGLRILIEDESNSHIFFSKLPGLDKEKFIEFPTLQIDKKYLSVGASNKYYTRLKELLPDDDLYAILNVLHDVPYLEKFDSTNTSLALKNTDEGFEKSLTRDTDSKKAIKEAASVLFGDDLEKDRFDFNFTFKLENFTNNHSIDFNFHDDFFPSNIMTLIGKNGSGKSQTLKHLSECLQGVGLADLVADDNLQYDPSEALSKIPQFSKVVIISYSPFEDFYNKGGSKSFSYSGLRDTDNQITKDIVYKDMKKSFSKIIRDDIEGFDFESSIIKMDKLFEVLRIAIPSIASIGIQADKKIIDNLKKLDENQKVTIIDDMIVQSTYTKEILQGYSEQELCNLDIPAKNIVELHFLDIHHNKLQLSSGQEIFTYMIFAILGKIEKESLLIFDEPESYLHPNLEIVFMRLLKEILQIFHSYSIIATHSLIITRETPSKFVRVFDVNANRESFIHTPTMETFGGNLNTICNYTFENALEDKPFENWLENKIDTDTSIENILQEYRDKLNTETLMYIRNEILND